MLTYHLAAVRIQRNTKAFLVRRSLLRLLEWGMWHSMSMRSVLVTMGVYLLLGIFTLFWLLIIMNYAAYFTAEQAAGWLLTAFLSFVFEMTVQRPLIMLLNTALKGVYLATRHSHFAARR